MYPSLIFEQIQSPEDKLYTFFNKVYTESFDENERRTPQNLALEMQNPKANVCVIRAVLNEAELGIMKYYTNGNNQSLVSQSVEDIEHSMPVGILIYWEFAEFIYLGHFAIAEDFRNHKLGGQFLSNFLKDTSKPVILEVELPDTDLAVRRIGFYERLGLKLYTKSYMQPAYSPSLQSIPLYLMETERTHLLEKEFDKIVKMMHTEIYWESNQSTPLTQTAQDNCI
ncbi:MAG: hypothetical protein RRY15_00380 [Bacteroidales bacterium]